MLILYKNLCICVNFVNAEKREDNFVFLEKYLARFTKWCFILLI